MEWGRRQSDCDKTSLWVKRGRDRIESREGTKGSVERVENALSEDREEESTEAEGDRYSGVASSLRERRGRLHISKSRRERVKETHGDRVRGDSGLKSS